MISEAEILFNHVHKPLSDACQVFNSNIVCYFGLDFGRQPRVRTLPCQDIDTVMTLHRDLEAAYSSHVSMPAREAAVSNVKEHATEHLRIARFLASTGEGLELLRSVALAELYSRKTSMHGNLEGAFFRANKVSTALEEAAEEQEADAPHDQPMTKVLPEATVSSPQLLQSHHHKASSICLVTPLIPLVPLGGSAHPAQEHHVHTFARQPALLAVRVLPRRIWDVHEVSLGKVESRERYDG